jgi:hypothetical protein
MSTRYDRAMAIFLIHGSAKKPCFVRRNKPPSLRTRIAGEAIHRSGKALLFVNKKQQKNFVNAPPWDLACSLPQTRDSGAKVFCCFFSKKQFFVFA